MPDTRYVRLSRELFLTAFGDELGGIEPWVTDRLTSLLEEEEVGAGDTLFSAGDPPHFFYFLRSGTVKLVRDGSAPWTLEGPHVFGMFEALLDRPRTRTALVVGDSQLMKVGSDAWIELLEESFELSRTATFSAARWVALLEENLLAHGISPRPTAFRTPRVPAGRLDILERLALLMGTPLLRGAGVQPLSDLALVSEEAHFDPGATLMTRGTPRDRLFMVLEGEVQASCQRPGVVRTAGPGDFVCGAAAFGERAPAWEASATTSTRALAFGVEDWFDLMEEHFELVRSVLAGMALERERLLDLLALYEKTVVVNPWGRP